MPPSVLTNALSGDAFLACVAFCAVVLTVLVAVKTLRSQPREKEALPRGEADLLKKARDEQVSAIDVRLGKLEEKVDEHQDLMVESLNALRVEIAKLTAELQAQRKK